MKKLIITQEDFDKLLSWLDEDKETAARKYYSIHRRLVQIFLARKAFPAEELADRVIDVVIKKIDYLTEEFKGEPENFFYSVTHNIIREQIRKPVNEELNEKIFQNDSSKDDVEDNRLKCIRECVQNLPEKQRILLIKYFKYSKQRKINFHKKMSEELGVDLNHLRTKVYRIKKKVEVCAKNCFQKNNV